MEPERGELKSCILDGDNISERMLVFHEQLAKAGTRGASAWSSSWTTGRNVH